MRPQPEHLTVTKYGQQIPALDGVRGFAILWVMLHNCSTVLLPPLNPVLHVAVLFTHPGWIGVQLFFALSGFLITGGLLDTQGSQHFFRWFYTRRALRILPLYYAILILIFVVLPALYGTPRVLEPATRNQIWLWTFLSNWSTQNLYGFQHYWSVAIEEQFYWFWPLLVYRTSARRLFGLCIGIALTSILVRCTMALTGTLVDSIYSSTVCRLDALALGGAAAAAIRAPELLAWIRKYSNGLIWLAASLFVICIPLTHAYDISGLACQTFGYTVLAFASAVLVVRLATTAEQPGVLTTVFGNPALRSLGKYSYAIYLFHVILHQLVGQPLLERLYGQSLPPGIAVAYGAVLMTTSYLLAYCSYHGFEKHWLKLKNRFAPAVAPSNRAAVALPRIP